MSSPEQHGGQPRLEFYPPNSPTLQVVTVEQLPFTIGRGTEADLQISSTSVSREHVRLSTSSGQFLLQDLGSTNGTTVNGREISETILRDGDLVRIADIDLTFVVNSMGRLQRMVTQPLSKPGKPPAASARHNEVAAARTLGEALLWQSTPLCWSNVIDHQHEEQVATVYRMAEPHASLMQDAENYGESSTAARFQEMTWLLARERASRCKLPGCCLMRIEHPTLLRTGAFDDSEALRADSDLGMPVGVIAPADWALRDHRFLEACRVLKERGIRLAFEEFSGGPECITALQAAEPDYVFLSSSVLSEMADQLRMMRRLSAVLESCEHAKIRAVAPVLHEKDRQAVAEAGVILFELGTSGDTRDASSPNKSLLVGLAEPAGL